MSQLASLPAKEMLETLRCPACQGSLSVNEASAFGVQGDLRCQRCAETFPVTGGIPRLLLSPLREALIGGGEAASGNDARQVATAESFGFEWSRFSEMYGEWEHNFREYMWPHDPEFFRGKRVLDAGCGSGRHAYYAAKYNAEVWAVDLGPAVEVAARNTAACDNVRVVQADLYQLPFATESFDFIYSIGVLHHLPDPEAAFRNLLRFLKPGGEIQIYLYWKPENQRLKNSLLTMVTAVRQVTTRLPHRVVYALSYPAACAAYGFFVWPYQVLSRIPSLAPVAERIPMKQYAHYPFRVCVNDQLDRFSAPIENRYTKQEVEAWLERAGLEETGVRANYGWCAWGRRAGGSSGEVAPGHASGAKV